MVFSLFTVIFFIDNCFRENKNRYVLSFMACLVELKVFVEARLDCLVKGHTGKLDLL